MASGRKVVIDPTNITGEQCSLFGQMLAQYRHLNVLSSSELYPVGQPGEGSIPVQLTHSLLHEIKVVPDQTDRHLYRILSSAKEDRLGSGTFATVSKVLGTLHHKKSGSIQKTDKPRAVKLSNLRDNGKRSQGLVQFAYSEAQLSKLIPYLHAKKSVEMNDLQYLVMRQIPSIDLFSLLKNIYRKDPPVFSFDEQLQVSINAIKALLEVHEMGVVHRDVKLENMMFDQSTGDVKLIDFGFSQLASKQDIFTGGSALYAAPEIYNGLGATIKSDIFSLGIVLRLWWGATYPDLGNELTINQLVEDRKKGCNDKIVLEKHRLSKWMADDAHNSLILDVLNGMISFSPKDRITLEVAHDAFEWIKIQRFCLVPHVMLREAYRLARQLSRHPVMVVSDLNEFLVDLEKAVEAVVSLLSTDPFALKEFNLEHKIALLSKVGAKEDIMPLVTSAIQTFKTNHVAIQSALTRSDLTEDQVEDLQLMLNKFNRPRLTLDDIASIGRKAQILLEKLEPIPAPSLTMNKRG
ncbi:MAG: protein kinase [Gammaproteobacteria bacterium]